MFKMTECNVYFVSLLEYASGSMEQKQVHIDMDERPPNELQVSTNIMSSFLKLLKILNILNDTMLPNHVTDNLAKLYLFIYCG